MKRRGQDGDKATKRGPVPTRPPRGASRANPNADSGGSPGSAGGSGSGGGGGGRASGSGGGFKGAKGRPSADRPRGRAPAEASRPRREEAPDEGGWTFGIRSVETVLENSADEIVEVWVQAGDAGVARRRVREAAEAKGLSVREVSLDELSRLLGTGANHQGVAARLNEFVYTDEARILSKKGPQLIIVLDEVQDPHNFGAILRTAAGLGAAAVVIPKHRAVGVTPTVRKVSTGAVDQVPIARVTNLVRFMEEAREAGYWIYGTAVDEGEDVTNFSFAERAVLVLGSEGSGMRPLVQRSCDALLRLPLKDVESLNVSVACGIFLYAWRVQSGSHVS